MLYRGATDPSGSAVKHSGSSVDGIRADSRKTEGKEMRQTLTGRQAIGEILVEKELITPEQLEAALEVQREHGGLLGEILVAQGLIDRIAIASVLVRQWSSTPLDAESDDVSSCEAADR